MVVPDLLKAYSLALVSLLAGAAVVHNLYKPDLVSEGCSWWHTAFATVADLLLICC